jgi:hypothetical protein
MHVMLGHPIGDLTQIAADMGQARAGAQQICGQRVPSLMSDVVAEVEAIDPGPEPACSVPILDAPRDLQVL